MANQDEKKTSKEYKPTDEEAAAIAAAELGFLGFCQTLAPEAVVTPEGVYANRAEEYKAKKFRAEQAEKEEAKA